MTGATCGARNAYPSGAPDFWCHLWFSYLCLLISCCNLGFWIL